MGAKLSKKKSKSSSQPKPAEQVLDKSQQTYQNLIDMGFDAKLSKQAAREYGENINNCISFINLNNTIFEPEEHKDKTNESQSFVLDDNDRIEQKHFISDIDEAECVDIIAKSIQNMLNDFGYNIAIKWLLAIWQNITINPTDNRYPIIDCVEIMKQLNGKKYIDIFQVLLKASGFKKSRNKNRIRWIYDVASPCKLKICNAFWSEIVSNWNVSNDSNSFSKSLENVVQELFEDGFSFQDAKLAIYASLNDDVVNTESDVEEKTFDTIPMVVPELNGEFIDCDSNNMPSSVDSAYLLQSTDIYKKKTTHPKCCDQLIECDSLNQINRKLNRYNSCFRYVGINENKARDECDIDSIFDNHYEESDLLNDFNHLLTQHSNEFENIHNILIEKSNNSKMCHVFKCLYVRRNGRNRFSEDIDKQLYLDGDVHCIVRQQLLDRIHAYYFHSFDIGHRLTKKEKEYFSNNDNDSENNHKDSNVFSSKVKSIQNLINQKKKTYSNINQFNVSRDNKFTVKNEYSFGFRFFYWNYYKDNVLTNDVAKKSFFNFAANIGSTLGDWYIYRKYANLKSELLQNRIMQIPHSEYKQLFQKAINVIQTILCRQMKCVRTQSAMYYDMQFNEPMQENHLMSMMIYCNYDKLSSKFTETFRFVRENESNEEMKIRHSNYYHLGKYLRECVECFGMKRPQADNIKLFHGINKQYSFASINALIHGPFSTSLNYSVAVNFCNTNGMILNIEIKTYNWVIHPRESEEARETLCCFDCQFISDFPSEQEVFFVGGKSYFTFNTIIDASVADDYCKYVKGLRQMTFFMSNGWGYSDLNNIPSTKEENQMVFRLLSHQIWRSYPNHPYGHEFRGCPDYFKKIMHKHCQNIVLMSFAEQAKKSVVHEKLLKDANGWMELNLLMKLFPNTRCIYYNYLFSCIAPTVITDSLFQFLGTNKQTNLEEMKIKIHPDFFEYLKSDLDCCRDKLYNQHKWIIYYTDDKRYITISIRNIKKVSTLL